MEQDVQRLVREFLMRTKYNYRMTNLATEEILLEGPILMRVILE